MYLCKLRLIVNTLASNKVFTPYVYAIKSRPCLGDSDKAEGNALCHLRCNGIDAWNVSVSYTGKWDGGLCCEKHFELGSL